MKLIVLGSGTSVPHSNRAASGYWLQTAMGQALLDFSADVPRRMAQEGLDWTNLDAIWLSHFHLDHIGGLAPFLFGTRSAPQTQNRSKPLKIFGPVGFVKIIQGFDQANDYRLLKQPFSVELKELNPGDKFELLPDLSAKTFSTPHTRESLAIRLQDKKGCVFVYTSDTGYSDELAEFARDARLLLMECSFRAHKPVQTHLELADAMRIANECRPQTLVLTHLYYVWDGIDLAREARQHWHGETIEAIDGLSLEF